jgi:hypothetical protein
MEMVKVTMMPLAALLVGTIGAALPATARPEASQVAAAPAVPRDDASRARVDKPLVMLVCEEVRAERRSPGAHMPNLACRTRWAGL